ncbi:MAG TPA: hypothetical protein PKZ26_10565 [Anaerolineaceae bacterium]|nr:hypothetical protein [Anaerolineaceae bacterium]NMC17077.1 hypothetical protein [Chloroflexota bacterium]HNS06397.1 hypothetical protein [Anaerolineaceae bacterium]HQM55387.1 hypothetical protein [Anaerolineaceae bacterium]HUM64100.1 hypothetical protein [Anaerolineaceae bacterium]
MLGILSQQGKFNKVRVSSPAIEHTGNNLHGLSFKYMDAMDVPGKFDKQEDNVVVIYENPEIATFSTHERDNFIVYAYTNKKRVLLLNEIGPYTGEKILPNDVVLLIISKNGFWSMDFTSK